jgi:hypothetical protein
MQSFESFHCIQNRGQKARGIAGGGESSKGRSLDPVGRVEVHEATTNRLAAEVVNTGQMR